MSTVTSDVYKFHAKHPCGDEIHGKRITHAMFMQRSEELWSAGYVILDLIVTPKELPAEWFDAQGNWIDD